MYISAFIIAPDKRGYQENVFSYFSRKTCGYLLEASIYSTQNMFSLRNMKKYQQFWVEKKKKSALSGVTNSLIGLRLMSSKLERPR